MTVIKQDVVLYNPAGRPFRLTAHEWDLLLETAQANGWAKRGTVAPPVRFDEQNGRTIREDGWTGTYSPAAGQTVTRADARDMIGALARVQRYAEFAVFATAGFIVTEAAGSVAELTPEAEQPTPEFATSR